MLLLDCAASVNVTNWLAAMAAAAVEPVKALPPKARAAPVPVVPTPEPRVRPPTVTAAAVVGGRGEGPKLFVPPGRPCTSQAAKVTTVPVMAEGLMVVMSVVLLFAELASSSQNTVAVLVTLGAALEATFTVTTIG